MVDINRIALSQSEDQFAAYLRALSSLSNENLRPDIVKEFHEKYPQINLNAEEFGFFQRDILTRIVQNLVWKDVGSGTGLNGGILQRVIDKFIDEGLLVRVTNDVFELNKVVRFLAESGNLPFYVLGLPQVAKTMNQAVVAINVKDAAGEDGCGSGVILHSNIQGIGLVLTNRHVVYGNRIVEVIAGGRSLQITSDPILSESADLAKFNVVLDSEIPKVIIAHDVITLDEIVSIGYPSVPTSANQSAMAHRGEVNGIISSYDGQDYLAISCHVSPGNSGGPIFNKYGYCAGLVTHSGTAKYIAKNGVDDGYAVSYHMAIPVEALKSFVA